MSTIKHLQEPWAIIEAYGFSGKDGVVDAHGDFICLTQLNANASRIVACVNALEGLSGDALDGGWNFRGMSDYTKGLEAQRDELLAALKSITYTDNGRYFVGLHGDTDCSDLVSAAIAKVEAQL